jgi:FKBP-type peptidyl-prolyl cis-trans isomerase SlpA
MVVREGSLVRIRWEVRLEDSTLLERTPEDKPLEFVMGRREMLPSIEAALKEMKVGESKTVHLRPAEAFGEWREELVKDIPRNLIKLDKEPRVGATLMLRTVDGRTLMGRIVAVCKDVLRVDFNHPLAGKRVVITFELLEVKS